MCAIGDAVHVPYTPHIHPHISNIPHIHHIKYHTYTTYKHTHPTHNNTNTPLCQLKGYLFLLSLLQHDTIQK